MKKFLLLIYVLILFGCVKEQVVDEKFYGMKLYQVPESYDSLLQTWKNIGFNTVYAREYILEDEKFHEANKKYGFKTFLISLIFFNPEFLQENPSYYAIDQNGNKAQDEWVHFVCPNREDYINLKIEEIKSNVERCKPDYLSLDFIRYFAFWEKVYPGTKLEDIPNTCFCDKCLEKFKLQFNIKEELNSEIILREYQNQWTNFKQSTITNTVKKITTDIKSLFPQIKISLHTVPWHKNDFKGARAEIVAQNLSELKKYVDVFSPMTYSHMVKQQPNWIKTIVDEISKEGKLVLPAIQANKAYLEEDIDSSEFTSSVKNALTENSAGMIIWDWNHLKNDKEKMQIVKKMLNHK